jgi:hypothetical protein
MKTKNSLFYMNVAEVSAWRSTGREATTPALTGFGLRLGFPLRDAWVQPGATWVRLKMEGIEEILGITLKPAFWNKCPEFKHARIGGWIAAQGLELPWPEGSPYKFKLERLEPTLFRAYRQTH